MRDPLFFRYRLDIELGQSEAPTAVYDCRLTFYWTGDDIISIAVDSGEEGKGGKELGYREISVGEARRIGLALVAMADALEAPK